MPLVQLLYYSRPDPALDGSVAKEIAQVAASKNAELDVTGYLLYTPNWFVQALEGSPRAVNAIYSRIVADTRHHEPVLASYERIPRRDFGPWDMGVCLYEELREDLFMQFGPSRTLDPRALEPDSLRGLMRHVAEWGPHTD